MSVCLVCVHQKETKCTLHDMYINEFDSCEWHKWVKRPTKTDINKIIKNGRCQRLQM